MKHWPDRSTMQGFKIHPAYIPRPATNGGSRLHLAAVGDEPGTSGRRA
jgi:hypothetical protein